MDAVKKLQRKRLVTEQPEALVRKVKLRAIEEDKSVTDVVGEALQKHLNEPPALTA